MTPTPTELVSVDQGLCTTPKISDVVQRPFSIEASSKGEDFQINFFLMNTEAIPSWYPNRQRSSPLS